MAANIISLPDLGAALAGLSALSTASFGLLDLSKGVPFGVSNLGAGKIRAALLPFREALANALGADGWWPVVRANWIAGVAKADQKAKAQALIKLGLSSSNAGSIAAAAHVDPAALEHAVKALETGAGTSATGPALSDADLNVLGRMNATIDALMDAAFEAADEEYRNVCRLLAGVISIVLAIVAWRLWPTATDNPQPSFWTAVGVGVLAVPFAPVAKDLTSALSTAMQALKAANKV